MRTFIAVEPSKTLRSGISRLRRDVPGVKWVPSEQIHLTLNFLGGVDDGMLTVIAGELRRVRFKSFSLTIGSCGFFPNERRPNVFWLGLGRSEPLTSLKADIDARLQRVSNNFLDDKPFVPHLTLARLKRRTPKRSVKQVASLFPSELEATTFTIDAFFLFSSVLRPEGALHAKEEEFKADDIVPPHLDL